MVTCMHVYQWMASRGMDGSVRACACMRAYMICMCLLVHVGVQLPGSG